MVAAEPINPTREAAGICPRECKSPVPGQHSHLNPGLRPAIASIDLHQITHGHLQSNR